MLWKKNLNLSTLKLGYLPWVLVFSVPCYLFCLLRFLVFYFLQLHEHIMVSISHTIYLHGIWCQFLLISYWIPHWLLFDVLYTFLFLYFHSYSLHRWSANPRTKLWSISTKSSILCVVIVGSSRHIWVVIYCNDCNRLM